MSPCVCFMIKRDQCTSTPVEVSFYLLYLQVIKSNDIDDAPDEDGGVALPTPSMVINVTSERALEVTMTKKCLEVINNLSKVILISQTPLTTCVREMWHVPLCC